MILRFKYLPVYSRICDIFERLLSKQSSFWTTILVKYFVQSYVKDYLTLTSILIKMILHRIRYTSLTSMILKYTHVIQVNILRNFADLLKLVNSVMVYEKIVWWERFLNILSFVLSYLTSSINKLYLLPFCYTRIWFLDSGVMPSESFIRHNINGLATFQIRTTDTE